MTTEQQQRERNARWSLFRRIALQHDTIVGHTLNNHPDWLAVHIDATPVANRSKRTEELFQGHHPRHVSYCATSASKLTTLCESLRGTQPVIGRLIYDAVAAGGFHRTWNSIDLATEYCKYLDVVIAFNKQHPICRDDLRLKKYWRVIKPQGISEFSFVLGYRCSYIHGEFDNMGLYQITDDRGRQILDDIMGPETYEAAPDEEEMEEIASEPSPLTVQESKSIITGEEAIAILKRIARDK